MVPPRVERDLLSVADIANDLPSILARAQRLKQARLRGQRPSTLRGRTLALLFEKPSTRTRVSFEVAIRDLGGHALFLSSQDLQLGRGETIGDTARVLSRLVDAIAYRAFRHADVLELARWATIPVLNALDDAEHPCQITADLLTLFERWKGKFRGRRLAYIGDGNNVLNSLILGAAAVGLDLTWATPRAFAPSPEVVAAGQGWAERTGAVLTGLTDPRQAARDADAVYTDVWVSMGDEAERAERETAFRGYQLNAQLLALARPGAFAMHDLPAHRGLEITDELMDGNRQAIWDQAENRLHAQKALLEWTMAPGAARAPARTRSS